MDRKLLCFFLRKDTFFRTACVYYLYHAVRATAGSSDCEQPSTLRTCVAKPPAPLQRVLIFFRNKHYLLAHHQADPEHGSAVGAAAVAASAQLDLDPPLSVPVLVNMGPGGIVTDDAPAAIVANCAADALTTTLRSASALHAAKADMLQLVIHNVRLSIPSTTVRTEPSAWFILTFEVALSLFFFLFFFSRGDNFQPYQRVCASALPPFRHLRSNGSLQPGKLYQPCCNGLFRPNVVQLLNRLAL